MSLLRFLTVDRSLDKGRNTYGRFKNVGMAAFVPGVLRSGAGRDLLAEPAGRENEFLEQSEIRTQIADQLRSTNPMDNTSVTTFSVAGRSEGPFMLPAEQRDNNNAATSSEERKSTFLGRLLTNWNHSSRRRGTMLLQHVTPVRNDLSLSDLELLAPARSDSSELRGSGARSEQRFLGLFRSKLTQK